MWHIFSQLSHGGGVGDHRVCYLVVKRRDWHRFLLLASQFSRFRWLFRTLFAPALDNLDVHLHKNSIGVEIVQAGI